jgi:superfamily II DNA/RNA helicase
VSTCVGEEGLDIGEVDLIVCYDSQKNPIRLIQRMGRTGRKREGRIIILLTEGREEQTYKTSLAKKKNIYKIIANSNKNFKFYENNPLMIPKGLKPTCHKLYINVPQENEEESKKTKKKAKTKANNNDDNGTESLYEESSDKKKKKKTSASKIEIKKQKTKKSNDNDVDFNDNNENQIMIE